MKNKNKLNISNNAPNTSKSILQKRERLPLKDNNGKNQQNQNNAGNKNSNKNNTKNNNNQNSESFLNKTKNFFKDIWANKLKRYIAIGIASAIVVIIIIVVVVVCVTKKKSNENKNKSTDDEFDFTVGECTKPYNVNVYSDDELKAKLKECKYEENTELFNFALEAIKRHNFLRACHNAQPLMFNCDIMKISQAYAESKPEGHSGTKFNGQWMGENLFWSSGMDLTGEIPVDDWYSEIKNYNFETGASMGGVIGHFTQLVWKDSKELGIGYYCENKACTVVGNYFPGGNYENQNKNQVQNFQK